MIKGTTALKGFALNLRIAAQPQQQRHKGEPLRQDGDGSPEHVLKPLVGLTGRRVRIGQYGFQSAERMVQGEPQQVALRRHMVVDGRFADAQVLGKDAHGRGLVAVPVEDVDGDEQHGLLVVSGTAGATAVDLAKLGLRCLAAGAVLLGRLGDDPGLHLPAVRRRRDGVRQRRGDEEGQAQALTG